jgi:hypothetical protein
LLQTLRRFGVDGSILVMLSVDQMTNFLGMRAEAAQALRCAVDREMMSSMPMASAGMLLPLPSVSSATLSSAALGLVGTFGSNSPV